MKNTQFPTQTFASRMCILIWSLVEKYSLQSASMMKISMSWSKFALAVDLAHGWKYLRSRADTPFARGQVLH